MCLTWLCSLLEPGMNHGLLKRWLAWSNSITYIINIITYVALRTVYARDATTTQLQTRVNKTLIIGKLRVQIDDRNPGQSQR